MTKKKKKDENSVSSESMSKENKGLSNEELIKKYGDQKAPGFNEALKKGLDTRKRHTTGGNSPAPLKPKRKD
jgi:hypothetical protein